MKIDNFKKKPLRVVRAFGNGWVNSLPLSEATSALNFNQFAIGKNALITNHPLQPDLSIWNNFQHPNKDNPRASRLFSYLYDQLGYYSSGF